jgi:hypothetical protein
MSKLQRLVLDFRGDELVVRCLYRSKDSLNPVTKRRRRQVEDLVREGLRQALASLEGGAECVGTSGFTTREDILSLPRPDELSEARRPRPRSSSSISRVSPAEVRP